MKLTSTTNSKHAQVSSVTSKSGNELCHLLCLDAKLVGKANNQLLVRLLLIFVLSSALYSFLAIIDTPNGVNCAFTWHAFGMVFSDIAISFFSKWLH